MSRFRVLPGDISTVSRQLAPVREATTRHSLTLCLSRLAWHRWLSVAGSTTCRARATLHWVWRGSRHNQEGRMRWVKEDTPAERLEMRTSEEVLADS